MQLQKATRKKVKLRLGLSAVSGGGKTYSALLLAYGLVGDWSKIAVIDTENNSASLYSHLGEYNALELSAPYTPERYIQAIKACEDAGMECIIIDSITHEWDGKGGILEIHSSMTGNSFTNWSSITPRHQKFIDAILQSSCHVITTVRRKTEYEMIKDGLELLQKYGAKNLFFIGAIVYLYLAVLKNENKIEKIEAKLYDCYEDKFMIQRNSALHQDIHIRERIIAILPDERKYYKGHS